MQLRRQNSLPIDDTTPNSGSLFESVPILSDAFEMAPALNEPPLTQVQLTTPPNADSVALPRQELFVVDQHHHNNNLVQTINKETTPKISSPSSQPIYLQHPRISYSTNGYAKPSFQLAFIQQISTANGPAATSTGSSPVQQHMDRNNQPAHNAHNNVHFGSANNSHNDPVSLDDQIAAQSSTSSILHHHHHHHHQHQQHHDDTIPDDLDLSDAHLDLEDVDESTNELINHTLGPDNSHSNESTNNNNMGLQKDYLKENTEMEQMLGELANTSDLDLLQVFKSLAPSGTDNLCDLASGLALFNDVDVMNIGLEDVTTPMKEPDTQDIRCEIKKRQSQMMRKCDFLMRRLRKLQTNSMRDHLDEEVNGLFEYSQKLLVRKERESKTISTMQPINVESSPNQIAGASVKSLLDRLETVANEQQCVLKKTAGKYNDNVVAASALTPSGRQRGALALPASRLIPCFDSAFSGQLELAAGHLQTELKIVAEAIDSDATASSSGGDSGDEFNAYTKQQTAHQMQSPEMQSIENEKIWVFNGERMVRKYKTKKIKKQELERAKRAATRWARERASIASRWSWLLAQISDLDYRIRQHSELHQQIRKNKGAVVLQNNGSPVPAATPYDTFDTACSLSVNGYRGMLPGNTNVNKYNTSDMSGAGGSPAFHSPTGCSTPTSNEANLLDNGSACRTRAFERSEFRKRKLLQTTNLHTISKKAAKQSTVKCGCQWPLYPCALCTGRPDPTAPRDLPDMLAPAERVGLLDTGFHPVISFPRDISQSVHIEAMLRQPDFQTKAFRSTSKAALRGALALQKALKKDDRNNRKLAANLSPPTKKKYTPVANKQKKKTKKSSAASTPSTTKYKRISSASMGGNTSGTSAQHYPDQFDYSPNGTLLPRSKNTSPTPTGGGSSHHHRVQSDRKVRGAYDIDNIVIPYSVAASTRVEVLKCKEIPTPKWRTVDDDTEQSPPKNVSNDTAAPLESVAMESLPDHEDLMPETVQRRHEQALNEERKKFSTFLKFPWSTRSRANRRIDSRAESSGTNTPDPTSPAAKTPQHLGGDHEQPLLVHQSAHHISVSDKSLNQIIENSAITDAVKPESRSANGTVPFSTSTRRRTVSQKRTGENERNSTFLDPTDFVPPYEHRDFPLSDDLYDALVKMMPDDHHEIIDECLQQPDTPKASTSNDLPDSSYYNKSENPQTICKTICDFENFIGASSVSTLGGHYGPPDVGSHMLRDTDEETESIESGMLDEDQNDPDWCEDPPTRL